MSQCSPHGGAFEDRKKNTIAPSASNQEVECTIVSRCQKASGFPIFLIGLIKVSYTACPGKICSFLTTDIKLGVTLILHLTLSWQT